MTTTHLLYLHGFRSSPRSAKAQTMAHYVARHHPQVQWWCPQLPPSPREAMAMVAQGIAQWPRERMAVVGSSLGGFYASWIAHQCHCPSVLLNPAVHPARDLEKYIGEQTAWHDPNDRFFFQEEYIDELRALEVTPGAQADAAGPELAIIAQGDEVLDWREMQARYPHAEQILIAGSNHALTDFDDHLPAIIAFLALA